MIGEMKVRGLGRNVASGKEEEVELVTGTVGEALSVLVGLAMCELVGAAIQKGCMPVKMTSIQITVDGEYHPQQFHEILKKNFPEIF